VKNDPTSFADNKIIEHPIREKIIMPFGKQLAE
jgi:hypothetical protein